MDNKENSEHSLSPKEKMKMLVRLWKQKSNKNEQKSFEKRQLE